MHARQIKTLRRARTPLCSIAAAVVLVMVTMPALAAKDPYVIREHLLEHPDKSVTAVNSIEPHTGEALDELLATRVWKVAYETEGNQGESLVFMAVDDGEALRIHDYDQPGSRDGFVRVLPEDFRVQSQADAEKIVAATLDLHFGFPFSEPEMTVAEMRYEQRGNDHFFVDGERFGDATGYHVMTDDDGRVVGYEYSWELPLEPLQD